MKSVLQGFRRMTALLLLLLLGPFEIHAQSAAPAKSQPPATILIIRHAEKSTDGQIDLSPTGFERAKLLPRLFSPAGARPDLPTPQVLFATHLSEHSNRPFRRLPRSRHPCICPWTTVLATKTTQHLQPLS
jgi:hypothetical protein